MTKKIIRLSIGDGHDSTWINVDHLVRIHPAEKGAIVEMASGDKIPVNEEPEDVIRRIHD